MSILKKIKVLFSKILTQSETVSVNTDERTDFEEVARLDETNQINEVSEIDNSTKFDELEELNESTELIEANDPDEPDEVKKELIIPKKIIRSKVIEKKNWTSEEFVVPEAEGKVRFHDLQLPDNLMHAIADLGFEYCTPIQERILIDTLKGKDAVGQAQTGTGKTAAFLITIITKLQKMKLNQEKGMPDALILAPTRELALQIKADALKLLKYSKLTISALVGGLNIEQQRKEVRYKKVDIVVATPGRLLDFVEKKYVDLSNISVLVIDEADRMMDMGFMPDMKRIEKFTPKKYQRQTLLFSATFPDQIQRIANSWTNEAVEVKIKPKSIAAESVQQIVYLTDSREKYKILYNLLKRENEFKVMIFTNRKDSAIDLEKRLYRNGFRTTVLTGDIDQKKRLNRLEKFKNGEADILVATDVASRGLHIDSVTHVINFNLPNDPEDYVHRIGRTGRAGESGISISFACEEDSFSLPAIEKFLGKKMDMSYPGDDLLVSPPDYVRPERASVQNTQNSYYKKRPFNRRNKGQKGKDKFK